jgi:hypothetical protein
MLFEEGGYYADCDAELSQPFQFNSSFVVGAERARSFAPRPVKFAQWVFGSVKVCFFSVSTPISLSVSLLKRR